MPVPSLISIQEKYCMDVTTKKEQKQIKTKNRSLKFYKTGLIFASLSHNIEGLS